MMHLRIRLGAEHYALSLQQVVEVVELGAITPVPGSGATLLGLRNLRGEILPALDLRALLGVASGDASCHLVVVADGERRAGLAVDKAIDFNELPDASSPVDSPFVNRGVLVDGALVGVVDISALLLSRPGSSGPELS
jgi:chemotaxis signal transduction protein